MLVLSRKAGEGIYVGDDVLIHVIAVRGDKVKIGIEAPKSVPVHRTEVKEAIDRESRGVTKPAEGNGGLFIEGKS